MGKSEYHIEVQIVVLSARPDTSSNARLAEAALAAGVSLSLVDAMELTAGLVDSVSARGSLAVIAVVGRGMAGTPGIASRVFSALAANSINVIAIARVRIWNPSREVRPGQLQDTHLMGVVSLRFSWVGW